MASPSQPERLLFAEPFLAWRAWKVLRPDGEPRLGSCIYEYMWEPRVHVEATCMKVPATGSKPHDAPLEGCACGVYGSTNADHLRHYVQETRKIPSAQGHGTVPVTSSKNRVFGLVALWGVVIECRLGFRASKAYPRALYLPCLTHEYADGLHEAYGVPVHCVDGDNGFEALLKVVRQVRAQETDGGSAL